MESGRKAYHLIGGVLCERTVGEVGPILDSNREAVSRLLDWICGLFADTCAVKQWQWASQRCRARHILNAQIKQVIQTLNEQLKAANAERVVLQVSGQRRRLMNREPDPLACWLTSSSSAPHLPYAAEEARHPSRVPRAGRENSC